MLGWKKNSKIFSYQKCQFKKKVGTYFKYNLVVTLKYLSSLKQFLKKIKIIYSLNFNFNIYLIKSLIGNETIELN